MMLDIRACQVVGVGSDFRRSDLVLVWVTSTGSGCAVTEALTARIGCAVHFYRGLATLGSKWIASGLTHPFPRRLVGTINVSEPREANGKAPRHVTF